MITTHHTIVAWSFAVLGVLGLSKAVNAQESPESAAAREIARIAVMDLRQQERPTPDDMLIAAELLRIASSLDPSDADLIRRRIEALQAAGDDAGVIAATRELVAADPEDTVAQLRLLSWTVGLRQTVRERLQAYIRLVGDDAAGVVPNSVRGRLALDAAILARESGRDELFDRMLQLAIDLDGSNKEAVALAVAVRLPEATEGLERFNLLTQLLLADPMDPNTHFALADELVSAGAFRGARRFYQMALGLAEAGGESVDIDSRNALIAIRWHSEGPEPLLDELNQQLLAQRNAAERRVKQLTDLGESLDDVVLPEEVRLAPTADQYRVLAALALDRLPDALSGVNDLADSSVAQIEGFQEQLAESELSESEQQDQFLGFSTQIISRVATLRLLVGEDVRTSRSDISQLRRSQRVPEGVLLSLDALLLLRTGQPGAAIDILEKLADRAVLSSLTVGLAYDELGVRDEALAAYRRAVEINPLDPFALLARSKYESLSGKAMTFREDSGTLNEVALHGVPSFLESLTSDPGAFMTLRIDLPENNIGGLDQSMVRLRLRNTSSLPLAVGPDRPINSRFLFTPLVEVDAVRSSGSLDPEVVELSRRLSLQPREELVVELDPSTGDLGYLLDLRSSRRIRVRWRVLQGFEAGPDRAYVAGALSLSGETPTLVRAPVPLARASGAAIEQALDIAEGPQLAEALRVLRVVTTDTSRAGGVPDGSSRAKMILTVTNRFPLMGQAMRYLAAACVPPVARARSAEEFDDAAWAEPDPMLRTIMIATRVTDPDDPQLELAKDSSDPNLAAFAKLVEARLERTTDGFAQLNQGVREDSPDAP